MPPGWHGRHNCPAAAPHSESRCGLLHQPHAAIGVRLLRIDAPDQTGRNGASVLAETGAEREHALARRRRRRDARRRQRRPKQPARLNQRLGQAGRGPGRRRKVDGRAGIDARNRGRRCRRRTVAKKLRRGGRSQDRKHRKRTGGGRIAAPHAACAPISRCLDPVMGRFSTENAANSSLGPRLRQHAWSKGRFPTERSISAAYWPMLGASDLRIAFRPDKVSHVLRAVQATMDCRMIRLWQSSHHARSAGSRR